VGEEEDELEVPVDEGDPELPEPVLEGLGEVESELPLLQ